MSKLLLSYLKKDKQIYLGAGIDKESFFSESNLFKRYN